MKATGLVWVEAVKKSELSDRVWMVVAPTDPFACSLLIAEKVNFKNYLFCFGKKKSILVAQFGEMIVCYGG